MEVLIPLIGGPLDGEKHLIKDPDRGPPDELRYLVDKPLIGLAEGGMATTIKDKMNFHVYQRWCDCGKNIYKYIGIKECSIKEGEVMKWE